MSEMSDLIVKHEGIRKFPYKDTTGHTTIGVGRNLDERGITEDEAIYLLKNDIDNCINELSERLYWFESAPDKVKMVLIDMCFNCGIFGLLTFRNTLEHIKNGNYELAAEDMLKSQWAREVGPRALELTQILKS